MPRVELKAGDTAPDFTREDFTGQKITLSDYKSNNVLLCFFRYAGCPLCNLALHRLALAYKDLEPTGLKVIVFIQSEPENIQKNIYERHEPKPPFPIIADPKREIYDQYAVKDSKAAAIKSIRKVPSWISATVKGFQQATFDGSLTLVPAQFLINKGDQTIYKANYGVDYYDHLAMIEITEFAQFGKEN